MVPAKNSNVKKLSKLAIKSDNCLYNRNFEKYIIQLKKINGNNFNKNAIFITRSF